MIGKIETETYDSVIVAENAIKPLNSKYILIQHDFPAGTFVRPHFHPIADEWVIVESGRFVATINFQRQEFEIKKATSLYFPRHNIHSLTAISDISYTVIRSENDETIYLQTLMRERNALKHDDCVSQTLFKDEDILISYDVLPKGSFSRMYNNKNDSVYVVKNGSGNIHSEIIGGDSKLSKNNFPIIPKNTIHYISNTGKVPLEYLVVKRS
ncbi:MAG: cupin domain-containing protein [Candidatus Woesearchaeota archaeon]